MNPIEALRDSDALLSALNIEDRMARMDAVDDLLAGIAAEVAAGLFVDLDGENEPTIWRGDPVDNSSAVLRRCDLPAQHRDLWDRFADLVTPPDKSTPADHTKDQP